MNTYTHSSYRFNPLSNQIILNNTNDLTIEKIKLITNLTQKTTIYDPTLVGLGGTLSNNILTLQSSTSEMNESDILEIIIDNPIKRTATNAISIGNSNKKFRDNFASGNLNNWNSTIPSNDLINFGGNSNGASYINIVKSVYVGESTLLLDSIDSYQFPFRFGFTPSLSQRQIGQEFNISFVGIDENDNIKYIEQPANIIPTSLVVASNVATITTATPHGLNGLDRVILTNFADSRLNVGPVIVTPVTLTTFTVPITIANGTYTVGSGFVQWADPINNVANGVSFLYENTNVTSTGLISRRNGKKFKNTAINTLTTVAIQSNSNPYTDAFVAAGENEIRAGMEGIAYTSRNTDSIGGPTYYNKITQTIPDESIPYKLQIKAKNLPNVSGVVSNIASISKSGSATATVVCSTPHGLNVNSWVMIYGVRDLTNFPNLTTQTKVASIVNEKTFTIAIGAASTSSSAGGVVILINGGVIPAGVTNVSVQSISAANGILTVITNVATSYLHGESITLAGLYDSLASYEGIYKVARISGTTLELYSDKPSISTTNTGGALLKNTQLRLHTLRVLDYNREIVELENRGTYDSSTAIPVQQVSTISVAQSSGTNATTWSAAGFGGFLVADVAASPITTTTTSTTVIPGAVNCIGTYSNSFSVIVTAVSGTNPMMDIVIQESPDNGTNWKDLYHFPRITAVGTYTTPLLRATFGTRYRYIQTISGTSPSFTRSINRIQFSVPGQYYRNFINRTIDGNTLNSNSGIFDVDGCNTIQLTVHVTSATTQPKFILEGSEDGINFYTIGNEITSVSPVINQVYTNIFSRFVRLRTSAAGSSSILNFIQIKALGI